LTHPCLRREYLPELARVRAQREATLQKQKEDSTARMLADLTVDRASNPKFTAQDRWNPDEEEGEEEDGGELNIIDRSTSIIISSILWHDVLCFSALTLYGMPLHAECSKGIPGGMLCDRSRHRPLLASFQPHALTLCKLGSWDDEEGMVPHALMQFLF
jgi:hypothetical protein